MNVWIMNGEDNAADTICWRLDNQGSDPARVLITDQVQIIDRAVAAEIAQIITEQHIALCVIDPLQAWMGGGVDMHRANETREWAGMLRSIAQDTDCAFLFVRHRRKSASGDNKLYAGMGSIDITGFARSEISAIKAKDDTTYIVRSKGNVGTTGEALAYTIERHSDPLNDHGTLKWGASYAPNELPEGRATPSRVPRNLKVAKEWLAGFLADGPKTATEVFKAATLRGITEGTLKRAKVGVAESYQQPGETGAVWMWRFVEDGCESGVAGKARG
jgi:hypothetical protein